MFEDTGKTPEVNQANLFSRLFFWWTVKFFKKGFQNGLKSDDFFTPLDKNEPEEIANDLERTWNSMRAKSSKSSFMQAIVRTFWLKYFFTFTLVIFEQIMIRNSQPYIMNRIVDYFAIEPVISVSRQEAFICATVLIITIMAVSFVVHQVFCVSQILGMKIRLACCSLIYRKILMLNKSAFKKPTSGQIVNLLNNDVYDFDLLPINLNFLLITFIQIFIIFPIVWQSIGLHVVVGFGALFAVVIPMQGCVQLVEKMLRKWIKKLTHKRNLVMKEIIIGIEIIKIYVMEKYFDKTMAQIRAEEVEQLRRSLYIRVFHACLQGITCKIMIFTTLLSLSSEGKTFNSRVTYNISVYYHILQLLAIIYLPISIHQIAEIWNMIGTIQDFLLLEEPCESSLKLKAAKKSKNENARYCQRLNMSSSGLKVELEEVSASWKLNHPLQILNSITLKVKSGEFCAIIGPAGSGKSSLLNLLLQELPVDSGKVRLFQIKNGVPIDLITVSGFVQSIPKITMSYASQDPVLFTGTVRDNIIFGLDYDQARFREVAKICSLEHDFERLEDRDLTIVGEGGEPLSIGQKIKVNLARAVYKQADLYLIDDIFDRIEEGTAGFVVKECLLGFLRGKTRILVTDRLDYLKQADVIALIEKGSIKYQGTYSALKKESFEFNEALKTIQSTKSNKYTQIITQNITEDINSDGKSNFIKSRYSSQFSCREEVVEVQIDKADGKAVTCVENLEEPKVCYLNSWREISVFLLLVVLIILWQLAGILVDQWMAYWTTVESIRTCIQAPKYFCTDYQNQLDSMLDIGVMKSLQNQHKLIVHQYAKYIYIVLILGLIGLFILSVYLSTSFCINIGQKFYSFIFSNFLKAKMEFFNSHFSEKTSNRLVKDIAIMDNSIIPAIIQTTAIILQIIVTIVNIGTVIRYVMILFAFLVPALYFLTKYFCKTLRNVQEIENATKYPLNSFTRETLQSLTVIRRYSENSQRKFCKKFDQYQEINVAARYVLVSLISAYSLAIELLFCVFLSFAYFSLIIMHEDKTFNESVGFAVSQSLILMSLFQYSVQQIVVVVSQLIVMRRIVQFIDLPKEGLTETPNAPPVNWPSDGQIIWKNSGTTDKMSSLPAQKNKDLIIEPSFKVGVVERAGAEKSSIVSALFGLLGRNTHEKIVIDGLDTRSIPLQDLRSRISIIPRDPFLFTGTLRFNLDPFQKYTDKAMWDVLGEVELNGITLDQWIADGGKSLSVNERKLICLARELLRSNRILVLDRIIDDLDLNTKIIIQRVLQSYFKYSTIITITDHLKSIISGDLILLMENGRLLEFGSPYELLVTRTNSTFGHMIKKYHKAIAGCIIEYVIKYHAQPRRFSSRKK